jgi:putative transposase
VARKWSKENLPGALYFITGIVCQPSVFDHSDSYQSFADVCTRLKEGWPFKLIAYVLMPDRIHLIVNPMDGRIEDLIGKLESLSTGRIVETARHPALVANQCGQGDGTYQVWQEHFKAIPLSTGWMIWRRINYIHSRPAKAGLVQSASDYRWSSYRSFHFGADEPIRVDRDWWWPERSEPDRRGRI